MSRRGGRHEAEGPERPLRFLLVVDSHTGHVVAAAGVVQRLLARGHAVTVICPSAAGASRFADFDIEAEAVPELASEAPPAKGGRRAAREFLAARIAAASAAATRVAAEGFDLALIDPFMLWIYPWLAPWVRCAALSTKPDLGPDPAVPPWTSTLVPRDGRASLARVRAAWWRERGRYLVYAAGCVWSEAVRGVSHRSLTRAAIAHAGHPGDDLCCRPIAIDMRFASVPELILHAREFDFPRRIGAASHIGPCLKRRRGAAAEPPPAAGRPPLVYCTLGTEHHARDRLERYRAVIASIGLLEGWRGLIATADAGLARRLREDPAAGNERVEVVEWADSPTVMRRARVTINHGGANSTKEAIAAGCPLVVMPMRWDQPGIGARVAYHGLGRVGTAYDPPRLAAAIAATDEDPAIRGNVERMASVFARYDRDLVAERTLERLAVAPGWSGSRR